MVGFRRLRDRVPTALQSQEFTTLTCSSEKSIRSASPCWPRSPSVVEHRNTAKIACGAQIKSSWQATCRRRIFSNRSANPTANAFGHHFHFPGWTVMNVGCSHSFWMRMRMRSRKRAATCREISPNALPMASFLHRFCHCDWVGVDVPTLWRVLRYHAPQRERRSHDMSMSGLWWTLRAEIWF